jgi:hypothetical protein
MQEEKRKEEMKECTFKPSTTPVPAYLSAGLSVGYAAQYKPASKMGATKYPKPVTAVTPVVPPTQNPSFQHHPQMPDSSCVASSRLLTLEQRAQVLAALGALHQRHLRHPHSKME